MAESLIPLIGLLLGAAVASGLRLYATVAVLGFLGRTGVLELPEGLAILTHSWVIVVAASLYLVEFLADKIPLVCGGVALSAHGLKSSTRAVINTSPEPVTNWLASLAEDGLTAFLLFLAVKYPVAAACVAAAVVVLAILLVTWMARTLRRFLASRRGVTAAA
jgi:hypothetical protein